MPDHKPASSASQEPIANLEGLLTTLSQSGSDPDTVSLDDIRRHLGRRAYGPVLALAALPALTPISTIPLLPVITSIIIFLTAAQMLARMPQIWLPKRLLHQSLSRKRLIQMAAFVTPAARFIDRLIRPRLDFLTHEPAVYSIAGMCCFLAAVKLPLEVVPFTSGIPSFPVLLFGLALTARDGVLVIVSFVLIGLGLAGLGLLGTRLFG